MTSGISESKQNVTMLLNVYNGRVSNRNIENDSGGSDVCLVCIQNVSNIHHNCCIFYFATLQSCQTWAEVTTDILASLVTSAQQLLMEIAFSAIWYKKCVVHCSC